jgi:hypothetical protein
MADDVHKSDEAPALKDNQKPGHKDDPVQVRPAGEESMADKPEDWDKHDEAVDESFPASDPPSTY